MPAAAGRRSSSAASRLRRPPSSTRSTSRRTRAAASTRSSRECRLGMGRRPAGVERAVEGRRMWIEGNRHSWDSETELTCEDVTNVVSDVELPLQTVEN